MALDPQGDIWLTGGSNPSVLPLPSSIPLLGPTFVAELSADGSSVINAITAPTGAAGQAIVITPNGSPASLGFAGSLLLDLPANLPPWLGSPTPPVFRCRVMSRLMSWCRFSELDSGRPRHSLEKW